MTLQLFAKVICDGCRRPIGVDSTVDLSAVAVAQWLLTRGWLTREEKHYCPECTAGGKHEN